MRLVASRPVLASLLLSASPGAAPVRARGGGSLVLASRAAALSARRPFAQSAAFAISSVVGSSPAPFGAKTRPLATPRKAAAAPRKMSSSSPEGGSSGERVPGRVALLQFRVTESKLTNHATARSYLDEATARGAQLCVLPEIWNGPYAVGAFGEYAEVLPGVGATLEEAQSDETFSESARLLMQIAAQHGMWIVGGSVSERVSEGDGEEKIYNTCLCIDPEGNVVAKHRKVHLFDIDVPGGITFKESDTLSPGETMTSFDAGEPLGVVGVGICYDIRFPEYALLLCKKHKCNILCYPGAFNLTTGPAHWELLQRGRAVDNQVYVCTASPARSPPPEEGEAKYPHYSAWGHSTCVNPWGEVVATIDEGEGVVVADLDMGKVAEMRSGIPILDQKRNDMYRISEA